MYQIEAIVMNMFFIDYLLLITHQFLLVTDHDQHRHHFYSSSTFLFDLTWTQEESDPLPVVQQDSGRCVSLLFVFDDTWEWTEVTVELLSSETLPHIWQTPVTQTRFALHCDVNHWRLPPLTSLDMQIYGISGYFCGYFWVFSGYSLPFWSSSLGFVCVVLCVRVCSLLSTLRSKNQTNHINNVSLRGFNIELSRKINFPNNSQSLLPWPINRCRKW